MKNIQKIVFLSLIAAFFLSSNIFAQAKTDKEIVIIKKVVDANGVESEEKIVLKGADAEKYIKEQGIKVTEKKTDKGEVEMIVEMTAEGEVDEEMTVTVIKDGDDKEIKSGDKMIFIDADGKNLPDDVKQMLIEKGIDIEELIEGDGTVTTTKKYKVVELDDDGNKKVIEWNGEGQMPAEMQELMNEHNIEETINEINIEEEVDLDIDEKDGHKVIKIKKIKNGDESVKVFEMKDGEAMPQEVLDMLKEHDIDLESIPEDGRVRIEIKKDEDGAMHMHDGPHNKAQLGVMIEDDDSGVMVSELIEGGAAKVAGVKVSDIITKVDKTKVANADELIHALADKKAGDVVKLTVFRDGELKKIKVILKAPEVKSAENFRTKHKVLKIKGGDINVCEKPEEGKANTESLTEEEIEKVEKEIIEQTGQQVAVHSGPNTLDITTLDLYPNPTDGNIRVKFAIENKEETSVRVIDIAGRTIYEKTITDFDGFFDEQINLPRSKLGTMVLVISQGKNVFTEKILLN